MFKFDELVSNLRGDGIQALSSTELGGQMNWDPGLRRPYRHTDGKVYVDVTVGHSFQKDERGSIILNNGQPIVVPVKQRQLVTARIANGLPVLAVDNASVLTKDAWIRLDAAVMSAVRPRLRAYADLRGANVMGGFDGMSTPILEREMLNDPGDAIVDMDGLSEGRNFQPDYSRQGIPLPIVHSDFFLSSRFLAVSRAAGHPADMTRAEIAGRRVGETIEKMTIGTITAPAYGTSTSYLQTSKVYGYRSHPARITKTDLTASATIATNIATTGGTSMLSDVLEMIALAASKNYHGPFVLYVSTAYDDLLDYDFKAESDLTIRQRILQIEKISSIRRLDYLSGDEMIMVQMTSDVAQAVNGMEVSTVQWETKGGMQLNFKVLGIQVPYIKSAFLTTISGNAKAEVTGVIHGTTS